MKGWQVVTGEVSLVGKQGEGLRTGGLHQSPGPDIKTVVQADQLPVDFRCVDGVQGFDVQPQVAVFQRSADESNSESSR